MKAINLIAGATWLPFSSYFLPYSFFMLFLFCSVFFYGWKNLYYRTRTGPKSRLQLKSGQNTWESITNFRDIGLLCACVLCSLA